MNPLDLYAKVEPLIGFYDTYENLYASYLHALQHLHVKRVLDVGCGNGRFLELLKSRGYNASGVDLSPIMVERAKKRGVDVECKRMEDLDEKFDALLAVADVLNYMNPDEAIEFLKNVNDRLLPKGYLLFDVNTKFGFECVADGTMVADEGDKFLAVEANYMDKELVTDLTYFEKEGETFTRHNGRIRQYYHDINWIIKNTPLSCKARIPIHLFSDEEADKILFVCQRK